MRHAGSHKGAEKIEMHGLGTLVLPIESGSTEKAGWNGSSQIAPLGVEVCALAQYSSPSTTPKGKTLGSAFSQSSRRGRTAAGGGTED